MKLTKSNDCRLILIFVNLVAGCVGYSERNFNRFAFNIIKFNFFETLCTDEAANMKQSSLIYIRSCLIHLLLIVLSTYYMFLCYFPLIVGLVAEGFCFLVNREAQEFIERFEGALGKGKGRRLYAFKVMMTKVMCSLLQ